MQPEQPRNPPHSSPRPASLGEAILRAAREACDAREGDDLVRRFGAERELRAASVVGLLAVASPRGARR